MENIAEIHRTVNCSSNHQGWTPLHVAVKQGDEELVETFRSTISEETKLLLTDVRRVIAESDPASDTVFLAVVLDRQAAARRFEATLEDLDRRREMAAAEAL